MKSPRLKPKRHHFVVYKAFFSLYKCFKSEPEINVDRQAGEAQRPSRYHSAHQSRGRTADSASRARRTLAIFDFPITFQRAQARRARPGCSQIPQSGKSERNLGRPRAQAALARGSNQSREKARTLQHCTNGEAGDKEGAQEGPQSQKAMTGSHLSIGMAQRMSKWDAGMGRGKPPPRNRCGR